MGAEKITGADGAQDGLGVRDGLKAAGFKYKKALGQNFIFDANLLNALAADAGIERGDKVLEVGAGAGTLTRVLASRAASVTAYETDAALKPFLEKALSGLTNAEVVYKDILKASYGEIAEKTGGGAFKMVANLPYYITTPVLFYFLQSGLPVKSITVTVQAEVAARLTAAAGTKEYGALTAAVACRGAARVTRKIGAENFTPRPGVDSAAVRIDLFDKPLSADTALYDRAVKAAFAMRRKTLANNFAAAFGLPRATCEKLLRENGVNPAARGETLSAAEFVKLTDALNSIKSV